jgi:glycerol-3-phosphate dehydrogenase
MAEDTVDHALTLAGLEARPCATRELRIHGWDENADRHGSLAVYGADAPAVRDVCRERPGLDAPVHPALPLLRGEVVWAARHEMARTVDDVLARRSRSLLFDARAAVEAAPVVAELVASELGREDGWTREQVAAFERIADRYLP